MITLWKSFHKSWKDFSKNTEYGSVSKLLILCAMLPVTLVMTTVLLCYLTLDRIVSLSITKENLRDINRRP